MYCSKCGKENNEESAYCNYCGNELKPKVQEETKKENNTQGDVTPKKNSNAIRYIIGGILLIAGLIWVFHDFMQGM